MCLGSHKYKEAFDPSRAQLATAPVIALFLAVFVLLQWYKRNTTKSSPMGRVQIRPGLTTFFFAGSVALLSCCAGTAQPCEMSIALYDEYRDLTSVARIGGSLHVYCKGKGSLTLHISGGARVSTPEALYSPDQMEMVIRIGNSSENRDVEKAIATGAPLLCRCDRVESEKYKSVPRPILCSAGSQLACGMGKICSVDENGREVCTDSASSGCRTATMKTTTLLCPDTKGQAPVKECRNIRDLWTLSDFQAQLEVPEGTHAVAECDGLSYTFT